MPVEPGPMPTSPQGSSVRELRVAGEIAQAFLTAERPNEVYRLALERVAPLADASFGCIFLRDGEGDLLRIVSAYNWPQRYASYLGSMRVRVGNGPTGRAVLENALMEVEDVFGDPELSDWWDSARELRFNSAIALPLAFESKPIGALTFYFREVEAFRGADRHLLGLVASQLAATAEKAYLIDDLQRVNERLRQQNVDLEARYREAEEAKKLKNEFLATVSQELRTPLTAVLDHANLLKVGISGPLSEPQADAVGKIENASRQLVSLIDGLLDLTNLKLGRVEPAPELCDAGDLARTALSNAPEPSDKVKLVSDLPVDRIPIHTDPVLVGRVLDSLLSNALKFTSEGTVTLRLRIEDPGDESRRSRGVDVIWEIIDTGIGIDENDHASIFDEFRQAEGAETRQFSGSGLGLSVSRGLARRLGGDVQVQSQSGAGATFAFSLPSSVIHAGVE